MTAQITTFPAVPDSSLGRSAFVTAANQFGDDLTPFANEVNAVATEVNTNANNAATSASNAATAKTGAEAARDAAIAAATAVATTFAAATAYDVNDLVWDDASSAELYRCILVYTSTATPPSADATHWVRVNINPGDIATITSDITALQGDVDDLLDVPSVSKSAAYTLELADRGKSIDTTANVTVPPNSSVAFPVGATVIVTNVGGSAIQIAGGTGVTLRLAGTGATGTKTLASWGYALLRKVQTDVWIVVGAGL